MASNANTPPRAATETTTRVVRADPNRQGLLYAGTETGMYISFDDGASWKPFQLNLPIVPITDLAIKDNNLIVATQGRSLWILDDLTVTFFLDDGSEMTLTADKGNLNTDSNDIEVSGNVVVINREYKLRTEGLNYAHDKRVLYSTAPVTISGPEATLAADKISLDLNTNIVTLEGSVETTIADNFTR